MTDEELAVLILETRDNEPDPAWTPSDDEEGAWRDLPRVRAVWTRIAAKVRHRLESSQREQTAATLLAALIPHRPIASPGHDAAACDEAVALTDVLRKALRGGGE